jgi:hypothetical protein
MAPDLPLVFRRPATRKVNVLMTTRAIRKTEPTAPTIDVSSVDATLEHWFRRTSFGIESRSFCDAYAVDAATECVQDVWQEAIESISDSAVLSHVDFTAHLFYDSFDVGSTLVWPQPSRRLLGRSMRQFLLDLKLRLKKRGPKLSVSLRMPTRWRVALSICRSAPD